MCGETCIRGPYRASISTILMLPQPPVHAWDNMRQVVLDGIFDKPKCIKNYRDKLESIGFIVPRNLWQRTLVGNALIAVPADDTM